MSDVNGVRTDYPETQASIYEWGQATFGQPSALSIMSRFLVEVAELNDLLVRRSEIFHRLDVTGSRAEVDRLEAEGRGVERKLREELADAEVVLRQVAEACRVDLEAELQAKMKVNRARKWERLPGGRFQHVDGT